MYKIFRSKIPPSPPDSLHQLLSFPNSFLLLNSDYEKNPPYFGSTIGRVANRIANGKFSIDGEDFKLDCNEKGINHLHGGLVGFDKVKFPYHDCFRVIEDF